MAPGNHASQISGGQQWRGTEVVFRQDVRGGGTRHALTWLSSSSVPQRRAGWPGVR